MYGWSPPFTALRNSSMFPCVAQIGFGNCSGKHVVQICSPYRMVQSHRRLQLNSVSTVSFPFLKAPTWPLNLCLVHHIIMYTASEPFVADGCPDPWQQAWVWMAQVCSGWSQVSARRALLTAPPHALAHRCMQQTPVRLWPGDTDGLEFH